LSGSSLGQGSCFNLLFQLGFSLTVKFISFAAPRISFGALSLSFLFGEYRDIGS